MSQYDASPPLFFRHPNGLITTLLSLFLWLLDTVIPSYASPQPAEPQVFVVGVENVPYFPHFNFQQPGPSFTRELFDQFAADAGYQFIYLPLPIKRFSRWLFEENIDFKYPDNVRWQTVLHTHKAKVHFSRDVIRLISGTSVLAENAHKGPEFVHHLGTVSGFQNILWLSRIESGQVKVVEDPSPTVLVNQLLHQIVDGVDMDHNVVRYELQKLNASQKVVLSSALPQQEYGFQLSTLKHPEVIKRFDLWLRDNQKFIHRLKAKYNIPHIEENTARAH